MTSGTKMIYLDTSVIVNSFFTHERGTGSSNRLMGKIKDGEIHCMHFRVYNS